MITITIYPYGNADWIDDIGDKEAENLAKTMELEPLLWRVL